MIVVTAAATVAGESLESGYRRRLLDGMAAAVQERGYRNTTVADVVRHARTSRRTFYEHFDSKQDCFIAMLAEHNHRTIRQIYDAVDPGAPWRTQVRQAVEAWIAVYRVDTAITLAWIRDVPALGEAACEPRRQSADAFIDLIQNLSATPQFEARGLRRPTRQVATILFGGFRELMASTIEAGDDITDITDVAVETVIALIGPA